MNVVSIDQLQRECPTIASALRRGHAIIKSEETRNGVGLYDLEFARRVEDVEAAEANMRSRGVHLHMDAHSRAAQYSEARALIRNARGPTAANDVRGSSVSATASGPRSVTRYFPALGLLVECEE